MEKAKGTRMILGLKRPSKRDQIIMIILIVTSHTNFILLQKQWIIFLKIKRHIKNWCC